MANQVEVQSGVGLGIKIAAGFMLFSCLFGGVVCAGCGGCAMIGATSAVKTAEQRQPPEDLDERQRAEATRSQFDEERVAASKRNLTDMMREFLRSEPGAGQKEKLPSNKELRSYLRPGDVLPGEDEQPLAIAAYMLTLPKSLRMICSARICALRDIGLDDGRRRDCIAAQWKILATTGLPSLSCSDPFITKVRECLVAAYAKERNLAACDQELVKLLWNMERVAQRRGVGTLND